MNTGMVLRCVDALVLICVLKTAGGTLLAGNFGQSGAVPHVLAWYCLLVLYVACAWLARDPGRRFRPAATAAFLLGIAAGLFCAAMALASPPTAIPLTRLDWAGMSLAFVCSACASRRLLLRR